MAEKLGLNTEVVKESVLNGAHNNSTTTYHLLSKRLQRLRSDRPVIATHRYTSQANLTRSATCLFQASTPVSGGAGAHQAAADAAAATAVTAAANPSASPAERCAGCRGVPTPAAVPRPFRSRPIRRVKTCGSPFKRQSTTASPTPPNSEHQQRGNEPRWESRWQQ